MPSASGKRRSSRARARASVRRCRIREEPLQFARPRAVESELYGALTCSAIRLARRATCISSNASKCSPRAVDAARRERRSRRLSTMINSTPSISS